jgi:phage shock protein PspC (stress-responsive transcriptional regulator)
MTGSDLPSIPEHAGTEPGDVKRCPWCAETIRAEALKCRYCGSVLDAGRVRALTQPWARPREGRMIAGVCAGLAEQFGLSVTLIRLAFALGLLFSAGMFLLVYLALWMAMPDAGRVRPGRLPAPEADGSGAGSP